jgi:hypothetical protein
VAIRELEQLPAGLMDTMISMRAYANSMDALKAAGGRGPDAYVSLLAESAMARTVAEIEAELAEESITPPGPEPPD